VRRAFAAGVTGVLLVVSGPGGAQAPAGSAERAYPSKPIRLVVPFPPGGGNDYLARLAGQRIGDRLGQTVLIDNRAGAGGIVGTDYVAKAAPDGYTWLLGFIGTLAILPNLQKTPYDAARDFAAAGMLGTASHVVVVHPSLPVRSVKQLIALARAHPGELNYASAGAGTNQHLVVELFRTAARVELVHVPYKGSAQAALAVLSGETHLMFGSTAAVQPHVRAGRLAAVAVTSRARSPLFPGTPTLNESGLAGVEADSWYALLVPAATPSDVLGRIAAALAQVAAAPEWREPLAQHGLDPAAMRPGDYPAFVRAEREKWGGVMRSAGVRGMP